MAETAPWAVPTAASLQHARTRRSPKIPRTARTLGAAPVAQRRRARRYARHAIRRSRTGVELAPDAVSFIEALGLGTVDLVGHSMGGQLVQQVALDRPDLVRRLVLVGTGPRGGQRIGQLPANIAALFGAEYPRQEDMWCRSCSR